VRAVMGCGAAASAMGAHANNITKDVRRSMVLIAPLR
jgi:hypothetical protein